MKKKLLAIFMGAVMALGLVAFVACGDDPGEQPGPGPAPETYTVTFAGGEGATGTAPTMAAQEKDAKIELPANTFTKEGHTFAGWNDGTSTYQAGAEYTMPANAVTFTAQWTADEQPPEPTPETYTVTFAGGEGATGTAPTMAAQEKDAKIELPANTFTKEGHTFAGWNDGTTTYQAGAEYTMPGSTVTFTAQWTADEQPPEPTPETYTVTFEPNNGASTWTATVNEGENVNKPETDPTSGEKHFMYWADENGAYDFDTAVNSDITLEAVYGWKVTYDLDGATGSIDAEIVRNGRQITLPEITGVTYEGKTFGGWLLAGESQPYQPNDKYPVTRNVTFTAKWNDAQGGEDPDPTKYTVTYSGTYRADPASIPAVQQYEEGATVTLAAEPANNSEYPDFKFTGWKTGSTIYQPGDTYTMPASNVTFTAQWVMAYTISFDLNGGTGDVPAAQKYAKGTSVTLPTGSGLSKTGMTFAGWKLDDNSYDGGASYTVGNQGATFVAIWNDASVKYTITVFKSSRDDQIALIDGTVPTFENKAAGETFAVPANDVFTFAHYHINNWRVYIFEVDQSGESSWKQQDHSYNPGEEITMPNCNIQLKPIWNANDVTISFDANGGTGTMAAVTQQYNGSYSSYGSKFQNKFTAPANGTFQGWASTPNGTPLENGTKLCEPLVSTDDTLTLYAVWQIAAAPDLTINDLVGHWTATGHSLDIIADDSEQYVLGYGVLDDKYFVKVFEASGEFAICSPDLDVYYGLTLSGTTLTLEGDDTITFTAKTMLTSANRSEFIGKWKRSGTNQPWVIAESAVAYGLSLSAGHSVIVGDKIALWYEASGYNYVYVLSKSGDALAGYYDANEKTPEATTFVIGDFLVLYVEGTPNQIVNSGAAPDASKIKTPDAPEGKAFDKWVITGTQTEFDPTATMTADASITAIWKDEDGGTVYTGSYAHTAVNFLDSSYTIVKIVLNANCTKLTYTLDTDVSKTVDLTDNSSSTWKPDNYGADASYYTVKFENKAHYILVKADGTKLWVCDDDDNLITGAEFTSSNGEESAYNFVTVDITTLFGKKFIAENPIYGSYVCIEIANQSNYGYNIKLKTSADAALGRSFYPLVKDLTPRTTFTGNNNQYTQDITIGFIQKDGKYVLVVTSFLDNGVEQLSEPIELTEVA